MCGWHKFVGGSLYGKLLRGESVDESVIKEAFDSARAKGLAVFDLAQDYGFGQAQKMIGRFGCGNVLISSKFTPTARYKAGHIIDCHTDNSPIIRLTDSPIKNHNF